MAKNISWFAPEATPSNAYFAVLAAREVVAADGEPQVRKWRADLEAIFGQWRDAEGIVPKVADIQTGLLGGRYWGAGTPVPDHPERTEGWPPYACTGSTVGNYVSLLLALVDANYAPLVRYSASVPWDKMLATMVLAEAYDYPSGAVDFAHALLTANQLLVKDYYANVAVDIADSLAVTADSLSVTVKKYSRDYRRGGAGKKGKDYEPKRSIRIICDYLNTHDPVTVINFLATADDGARWESELDALRHERSDPIELFDVSVDKDAGTWMWTTRRKPGLAGDFEVRTLRRLGNILSELKREKR